MIRLSRREILFGASAALAAPVLLASRPAVSEEAKFPVISAELKRKLSKIVPSLDHQNKYYPCLVTLVDNIKLDSVYLIEADEYEKRWANTGRTILPLHRVANIEEFAQPAAAEACRQALSFGRVRYRLSYFHDRVRRWIAASMPNRRCSRFRRDAAEFSRPQDRQCSAACRPQPDTCGRSAGSYGSLFLVSVPVCLSCPPSARDALENVARPGYIKLPRAQVSWGR